MNKLILIIALAGCGTGGTPDPRSPESEAPAAVAATATRVLGDRDRRIGREGDHYEAEAATGLEVVIAADGTLIETEVEIPVAVVPAAIRAAVTGEIGEAALIITDGGVVYELELGVREVRLDAAGQIVGEETETDDADEPGDDD